MKKVIFAAILMAFGTLTFAQDVLFSAKVKKEKVPTVILESIEEDFPDETIIDYYGIPVSQVEDVWYVDFDRMSKDDDYDTYSINLSDKNGTLTAVYDKDGNLISEHEKLKDAALPHTINKAVGRHFPGWAVTGDNVVMTAHKGNHKKVHYKVKLKKDSNIFTAVFDANGNLLKGKEHSVHHKLLARKKHQNK